ncbi:hypothetical protein [Nonomuraea typhae]|uniref:Uncharacterized protein n=1 Tax=Nonomuraea typhae TaxID=2603600 RepID=A0ABW7Z4Q6_9ACTN
MPRFFDELRDPWGVLLGVTAGGAAWAVNVHPAGAVFVGVTVWLAKAGVAGLQAEAGPYPEIGGDEADWVHRAEAAVRRFAQVGAAMADGPLAERVAAMRPQVSEAMETLRRLAGHASVVAGALDGIDVAFLREEAARLKRPRTAEVADELARSQAAVGAQLEVYERLRGTRERLLARLESGTLGIEGLTARVVELSAMAATGVLEHTRALDELAGELDGIRLGLHETEEITRRALET